MMKTEEQRIDDLEEEIKEIRDSNTAMAMNVKEIRDALIGTPLNRAGLVSHIEDFKNRIENLEDLIIKGKWLLVGLSAGTGVGIVAIIKAILEAIFTHK